jgi:hypothetical protein
METNKIITRDLFDKAYTYQSYRSMTDTLLSEGKTTGSNQSQAMVDGTKLNVTRMNRIDKTTIINDELKSELNGLKKKLIWLVITEPWCGDAAQNVPVFNVMAKVNPDMVELKYILRDENPDVMNLYLTNGGKAIPILICYDAETFQELWKWGPRPADAQKLAKELAANPEVSKDEKNKAIQLWYANDKTQTLQNEFKIFLKEINNV